MILHLLYILCFFLIFNLICELNTWHNKEAKELKRNKSFVSTVLVYLTQ